jgi:hypothetical protein
MTVEGEDSPSLYLTLIYLAQLGSASAIDSDRTPDIHGFI